MRLDLDRVTTTTKYGDRKSGLLERIALHGGVLNEPQALAVVLAQVLHESGGFAHVREVWGPTPAQARYEGRRDLGNTQSGDGRRFMGRDLIQITGRANYTALSNWAGHDFVARPEDLEKPEWIGIGVVWFFLTRPALMQAAQAGEMEMATRIVNGGLNGYSDRLQWYDRVALDMLNFISVKDFQRAHGLVVDGISGPKTRRAMHERMTGVGVVAKNTIAPPNVQHIAQPQPGWLAAILAWFKGIK
jgi:putative chitinase